MTVDRPASPSDWLEIRRICCETGAAGDPIAPARRDVFGEVWIGPYERLLPEWTYLIRGDEGRPVGYLTGCPATREFETRKRWIWLPGLLRRMALRSGWRRSRDARSCVARVVGLSAAPERGFGAGFLEDVYERYPAHLHVNVDSTARGGGLGARLVAAFASDLRARGVGGVHLFCGPNPVAFYRRCGFEVLAEREVRPGGAQVVAMGRSLSSASGLEG